MQVNEGQVWLTYRRPRLQGRLLPSRSNEQKYRIRERSEREKVRLPRRMSRPKFLLSNVSTN